MLRNRLRTLEQQVNSADLPDDVKVKLQGYISGCYGSLTSFNVLFADEDDQFKGAGGDGRGQSPIEPAKSAETAKTRILLCDLCATSAFGRST